MDWDACEASERLQHMKRWRDPTPQEIATAEAMPLPVLQWIDTPMGWELWAVPAPEFMPTWLPLGFAALPQAISFALDDPRALRYLDSDTIGELYAWRNHGIQSWRELTAEQLYG
jgi:hypothetical protein